jgi:hypothetical protein
MKQNLNSDDHKMNPVPIMNKDREQNKNINAIKNYQNYIYQFHYKGNVLTEPLKVLHRSQFECHSFINAVLMVNECEHGALVG